MGSGHFICPMTLITLKKFWKQTPHIKLRAEMLFLLFLFFFTSFAVQRKAESDKVWSLNPVTMISLCIYDKPNRAI